jgi:D-cysteine desulfhydrase
MREVNDQAKDPFDVVAHACGSGGTAAGVAIGSALHGVATNVWAFAVCDDRTYFERTVARIAEEARDIDPSLPHAMPIIDDRAKGPAYAIMNDEQKKFIVEVSRASGVVLDPVYTGKALFGVQQAVNRGDIARGARVLFIHTGGLPGLLAQGEDLRSALD